MDHPEMDDRFLHDLRRAPRSEFSRNLRAALDERQSRRGAALLGSMSTRWLSAAASVAVVAVAFSFPSVRAAADSFLDLFRIVNFRAVAVDTSALDSIAFDEIDVATMLGVQPDSGPDPTPVSYSSIDEAGDAAGFRLQEPAWIPVGWARSDIEVTEGRAFDMIARTDLLDYVLDQLAIDDVSVPDGLDGATVNVNVPSNAKLTYTYKDSDYDGTERSIAVVEARNPEMSLPAGIEPAQIAEIGLRILGLDRDEAYRLAWTVDWRSTLLVPVPAEQASFREIPIGASTGIVITPIDRATGALVMWGTDQNVYVVAGDLPPAQLVTIAQSMQ